MGIGISSKKKHKRFGDTSQTLRTTAMIDVIFLLLIFFLLTANFRPTEDFLPILLPEGQFSSFGQVEPLVFKIKDTANGCLIDIEDYGQIVFESDKPDEFAKAIKDVIAESGRVVSDPVQLAFEDDVVWQKQVEVYNVLYGIGVEDITFELTSVSLD